MIDLTLSGKLPAPLTRIELERALRLAFLRARRPATGGISLAFVSDPAMTKLNRTWRHKTRSTDVLSFSAAEIPSVPGVPRVWGDLFVSPAFVRREAKRRKIPFEEELLRVVVHGALHLMGYDHATEEDEIKMFALQERIVEASFTNV